MTSGKKDSNLPCEFICEYCGKTFMKIIYPSRFKTQSSPRFCSSQCRNKARIGKSINFSNKPKQIKTCQWCKKSFLDKTSKQTQKYCSTRCFGLARRRFVTKACKYCGRKFQLPPSCSDRFYCSKECYWADMRSGRIIAQCAYCGKEFQNIPSRQHVYCSRKCRDKALRGENSPLWKGGPRPYGSNWESQVRKVKKRDDHTCQICGYKSGGSQFLDIHHIKPLKEFNGDWEMANQLDNLIALCRKCHAKVECGKIPCPTPRIT